MRRPQVLIIDDERNFREFLGEALEAEGYSVSHAPTGRIGLALAKQNLPDVVLVDQNLPDTTGMALLSELRRQPINPVVIMITAFADFPRAVEAVKAGAFHYLSKPFEFSHLLDVLGQASVGFLNEADTSEPGVMAALIGDHRVIQELKRKVTRAARSPVETLLVRGESGTGKELIARALHNLSSRAEHRLVSVNCAALTETLLMSELFGHERGAFTDAREQKKGIFEAAQGGTLFLDEIGEMGPKSQAALLRVLEQRVVRRVGGTEDIRVDLRVIAATNRDLSSLVKEGVFRADLFFRLNVVELDLPPLRERGTDVLLLARHFSRQIAERYKEAERTVPSATEAVLLAYSWPGNVRELRNMIERAYATSSGVSIETADLAIRQDSLTAEGSVFPTGGTHTSFQDAKQQVVDQFERRYLEAALARSGGNITRAAEESGMLRQVFQRLLRRHGIDSERI